MYYNYIYIIKFEICIYVVPPIISDKNTPTRQRKATIMSTEQEKARNLLQKAYEMYWSGEREAGRCLFAIALNALRYAIEYDLLDKEVVETWKYTLTGLDELYLKRANLEQLYDEFDNLYQQYYGYDDFCNQFGL
jgi:hypothetical protein